MNIYNSNNKDYNLNIYLGNDSDIKEIPFLVDGIKKTLSVSNKGIYAFHLGPFSEFTINDAEGIDVKIVERGMEYSKFYSKFKITLEKSVPDSELIRGKDYIFDDLRSNNGNDLYCSFNRLLKITLKYKNTKEPQLLDDIKYGLEFLMNNWYTGKVNYQGNWWFYEIGVPRCLNEILFLIKEHLDINTIHNYLNIERFYIPFADTIFYRRNYPIIYREYATYANLAENIYICTLRAVLQETYTELKDLFKLIDNTLKIINDGDGFYPDGSFIQHKNVPYNGSYGEVLLISLSKILNVYSLLNFDCKIYIKKIQNILYESYSPILFDGKVLESVRGRAVSRMMKNSKYSFDAIMSSINRLKKLFSTSMLKSFIKVEENRSYVKYAKSFNCMDRFISRNNKYIFSINLNSNYISNYENINGENLLGDYSSNYTFDLIFINDDNLYNVPIYVNPFYRNGSTNTFDREEPNYVYQNDITAGVDFDDLLCTCWHQNTDVKGYFSKFILNESMVAIGTDIKSDKEYISTIYNSNKEYIKKDNEVLFGNIKIVCNNMIVERFDESRTPIELNVNQDETKYEYSMNRVYMKNPNSYEYQLYPIYKKDEKYEFYNLNGCHILKYNNYLFINSFVNEEFKFEDITFKGVFSGILKQNHGNYELKISTGNKQKVEIMFDVIGCEKYLDGHRVKKDINLEICDELIHLVEFK